MHVLAASWTPEQWTAIITAVFTGLASLIVAIVAALKGREVHVQNQDIQRELKPPSNGVTLGTLVERIDQITSILAQFHAEDKGVTLELPGSPQVKSSIPNPNPGLSLPQEGRQGQPPSGK